MQSYRFLPCVIDAFLLLYPDLTTRESTQPNIYQSHIMDLTGTGVFSQVKQHIINPNPGGWGLKMTPETLNR
jgi:hypothetical protein